jgi:pectate lyase
VVNNDYASWGIYAVGGSEAPTIKSEGNHYSAPNVSTSKEVRILLRDQIKLVMNFSYLAL